MHFDGNHNAVIPNDTENSRWVASEVLSDNSNSGFSDEADEVLEDEIITLPANDSRPVLYTGLTSGSVFSILQCIVSLPLRLGYKAINSLYYFLTKIFPFLPRTTYYTPTPKRAPRSLPQNEVGLSSSSIINTFEETYGQTGLKFFEEGFAQAIDYSKSHFKYLVVVLQSDKNNLDDSFNRQVLTDSRVIEFLNEKDVTLWLGDADTSEGSQVALSLRCRNFPFVLLIAPFPRSSGSSAAKMKSLVTIYGETDPMQFIATLKEKMDGHSPIIDQLVSSQQEREKERQLRNEQNAAYERSLAADREREKAAKEEAIRKEHDEKVRILEEEKAALELERVEEEQRARKEEIAQNKTNWKLWRASQLGPEFNSATEKSARISVRLLSGERVIRKFSSTQTIDDIYAFVECHDILNDSSISKFPSEPPENYVHKYSFDLATTIPRKILIHDSDKKIIDDKALWPSASLVVEIDEYSDDE